jgi:hypothetical protein
MAEITVGEAGVMTCATQNVFTEAVLHCASVVQLPTTEVQTFVVVSQTCPLNSSPSSRRVAVAPDPGLQSWSFVHGITHVPVVLLQTATTESSSTAQSASLEHEGSTMQSPAVVPVVLHE